MIDGTIFTVRPPNEDDDDSILAIHTELNEAGLEVDCLTKGIIQPDGSTIWWVDIK